MVRYKMDNYIKEYARKFEELLSKSKSKSDYKKVSVGVLEDEILKDIERKPEILYETDNIGRNLGMICCVYGLERVVLKCLEDNYASTQQDIEGYNLGMYACLGGLIYPAFKSLDNKKAALQQNSSGLNIGMCAAFAKMEPVVLKALQNKEAALQKDNVGENIISIAQKKNLEPELYY